jgi:septum formation protein
MLLENAGVLFKCVTSDFDEEAAKLAHGSRTEGLELELELAKGKALHVSRVQPDAYILGCDQILELHDGRVLSKAKSKQELVEQLAEMCASPHILKSAAALAYRHEIIWQQSESVQVFMRPLSREKIAVYVEAHWEEVKHCVGGYKIEENGIEAIEKVEGSYFAVYGLPLLPILKALKHWDIGYA